MKAILFDFGGTLDTDGIHWSEKFWDVYQFFNVHVTKQQYEEAYVFSENNMQVKVKPGDTLEATLKKQVTMQIEYLTDKKYLITISNESLINKIHSKCFTEVLGNIKTIEEILKRLRQNYILGVVSNFYGNLSLVLDNLKIKELFDIFIDSTLVGIKKPDPQIFQIALNRIGIYSSDTVVIGDSYDRDIQPAKILGCTTIWLDGKSWTKPKDTSDADYRINSIKEVENILLNITQKKSNN